ncbi:MAG: GPR endopeptidase [Oscillospiraceae bacterium]|nr:GPR endopeptidase [Oscillospiraceae bacterium]MCI6973561.1 GPR endopeptidase [Clostridiales bacterium]
MQRSNVRTDLASEVVQRPENASLAGLELNEERICGCRVTAVKINGGEASKVLCKPIGNYLTLELDEYIRRRENSFSDAANALSQLMRRFAEIQNAQSFLVACLGNRAITPDAVGPEVSDSLIVTRHLKQSLPQEFAALSSVAVLRTGVLGTTGIESAQSLKALCGLVQPDCVIAVDALASGELDRLCRNVQICDSGIAPGSGVGNDRAELNRESLGVPVIAVGVPTVIDAAAFCADESAAGLFVTPRNIDELVRSVSKLVAYGLNLALHPGLSIADVDMLVE